MMRKGLGKGTGNVGYYNLVPIDSHIHSLSARGIKSYPIPKSELKLYAKSEKFESLNTQEKKNVLEQIKDKAQQGVDWAVHWEQEHLPAQKAWVQKAYNDIDVEGGKLLQKGVDAEIKAEEYEKRHFPEQKAFVERVVKGEEKLGEDIKKWEDKNAPAQKAFVKKLFEGKHEKPQLVQAENPSVSDETLSVGDESPQLSQEETYSDQSEQDEPLAPEPQSAGIPFPGMVNVPKPRKQSFVEGAGEFIKKEYDVVQGEVAKYRQAKVELHHIPDNELVTLGIQEGGGLFGGFNKYEKELFRREEERKKLNSKIAQIRSTPVSESNSSGVGNMFGFLNPVSTLNNEVAQRKSNRMQGATSDIGINLGGMNPLGFLNPVETLGR